MTGLVRLGYRIFQPLRLQFGRLGLTPVGRAQFASPFPHTSRHTRVLQTCSCSLFCFLVYLCCHAVSSAYCFALWYCPRVYKKVSSCKMLSMLLWNLLWTPVWDYRKVSIKEFLIFVMVNYEVVLRPNWTFIFRIPVQTLWWIAYVTIATKVN